jgi:hypothetical protein
VSLDPNIIALGIRQPWVELILRGIKTLEVRSFDTPKRGTIYLYASKTLADSEAAREAVEKHGLDLKSLPTGLLCGSVELADSRPATAADAGPCCVPGSLLKNAFVWALRDPRRFETPQTVRFLPYGVWFYPYRRRNGASR